MTPRVIRRVVALAFVLVESVFRYWLLRLIGRCSLERRAKWLQTTCRRVLRSIGLEWDVQGTVPTHGLVVSNHLSYLDIVVLSAAMPCFFVAKAEIDEWPYFGKAARVGGTLFIDRASLASAERVATMIGNRLKLPIPVLFFPEGTSTDGNMLRFHSRLFEPAIRAAAPITAAAVRYVIEDGTPERELCWYGDEAFAPHMMKTLRTGGFRAQLRFGDPHVYAHRRVAADETYAEIAAMRAEMTEREESNELQAV